MSVAVPWSRVSRASTGLLPWRGERRSSGDRRRRRGRRSGRRLVRRHGWQPFAFQREVWAAMAAGRSGLLHATTGSGKTYAVWFGALAPRRRARRAARGRRRRRWRALDHADARAGRRHGARAAGAAATSSASRWTRRPAHRRHAGGRARAAGPALADRAGHHARVAEPDADARARARRARRRAHRHRRRVARADGQQARRAGAARAGAAAALEPAASSSGACPRRSATSTRRCRCCSATTHGPRWCSGRVDEDARHRHAAARQPRALLLGRPPRHADAAAGGRGDRALAATDAGLHQHALAGRDLVPAAARGAARVGRR